MNQGLPARTANLSEELRKVAEGWFLLTMKKVVYAANIGEDEIGKEESELPLVRVVREIADREGSEVLVISAKAEEEIAQLDPEDKQMFLEDLGLAHSGLDRLVVLGYKLLGLISFLTAGPRRFAPGPSRKVPRRRRPRGKLHSDFERGFIRAEIVAYDDFGARGLDERLQGKRDWCAARARTM